MCGSAERDAKPAEWDGGPPGTCPGVPYVMPWPTASCFTGALAVMTVTFLAAAIRAGVHHLRIASRVTWTWPPTTPDTAVVDAGSADACGIASPNESPHAATAMPTLIQVFLGRFMSHSLSAAVLADRAVRSMQGAVGRPVDRAGTLFHGHR